MTSWHYEVCHDSTIRACRGSGSIKNDMHYRDGDDMNCHNESMLSVRQSCYQCSAGEQCTSDKVGLMENGWVLNAFVGW